MALSDLSPYVAMFVTVIVWSLTQRANRKHEIFRERLKRRVEMFDGLLPEISHFITAIKLYNEDNGNEKATRDAQIAFDSLGDYRIKMFCYGTDNERKIYEELIETINSKNMKEYADKNNRLVDLVRKNLRAELGIR